MRNRKTIIAGCVGVVVGGLGMLVVLVETGMFEPGRCDVDVARARRYLNENETLERELREFKQKKTQEADSQRSLKSNHDYLLRELAQLRKAKSEDEKVHRAHAESLVRISSLEKQLDDAKRRAHEANIASAPADEYQYRPQECPPIPDVRALERRLGQCERTRRRELYRPPYGRYSPYQW